GSKSSSNDAEACSSRAPLASITRPVSQRGPTERGTGTRRYPGDMAGKQDKTERKQAKTEKRASGKERSTQIIEAYRMKRKEAAALSPSLGGSCVVATAVLFGIGWLIGAPWFFLVAGVLLGVLTAMISFGRRVQRNVYRKADGQPGAAGWALDNLRGKWRVTQ